MQSLSRCDFTRI